MRRVIVQNPSDEKRASRGKRSRLFWFVAFGVSVVGLAVMMVGCLMLMKHKPVEEELALMENDIGREMQQLPHDPVEEGLERIGMIRKKSAEWMKRIDAAGNLRGKDAEIDRAQRLHGLQQYLSSWVSEVAQAGVARREAAWQKLVPQIRQEAKMWPVEERPETVTERSLGAGKAFVEGLRLGSLWPVWLGQRVAALVRMVYRGKSPDFLPQLRYIFYPYRRGSFEVFHLGGMALSIIGLGYLFCWAGSRRINGSLSYCGVLYFVYLIVFSTLFIAIDILAL